MITIRWRSIGVSGPSQSRRWERPGSDFRADEPVPASGPAVVYRRLVSYGCARGLPTSPLGARQADRLAATACPRRWSIGSSLCLQRRLGGHSTADPWLRREPDNGHRSKAGPQQHLARAVGGGGTPAWVGQSPHESPTDVRRILRTSDRLEFVRDQEPSARRQGAPNPSEEHLGIDAYVAFQNGVEPTRKLVVEEVGRVELDTFRNGPGLRRDDFATRGAHIGDVQDRDR